MRIKVLCVAGFPVCGLKAKVEIDLFEELCHLGVVFWEH
jgi:hypothetical protein